MSDYVTRSQWKQYRAEAPCRQATFLAAAALIVLAAMAASLQ